jgi:mono/diheme cytochrome c family protein
MMVLLGLLSPAVAAAQGAKGPDAEEAARGAVTYKRFCTVCHGAAGEGDGQLAGELRTRPADLTRLSARNGGTFPFDKVARAIDGRDTTRAHGPADMPVWGEVLVKTSGADTPDPAVAVARLAHFVWTLQRPTR